MQSLSTCLVAAALLVAVVNAQFQINTPPSITECVPVQFTWTGGQEPYFLAINPGGIPGATALQQYSGVTGTSFTWSANITSGTSIGLELTDTNGQIAQSAPVTIQSGPSTSCLTGAESSAASGSSTTPAGTVGTSAGNSPSSTSAPTTTAAGTKTGASSSGTGAGSASGSKTSGSASSASTSASGSSGGNGALSNVASAGVVGLVGVLAAALLA